jgi:hypothetical protein
LQEQKKINTESSDVNTKDCKNQIFEKCIVFTLHFLSHFSATVAIVAPSVGLGA